MAHELDFNAAGKASMAYVGDVAWHGLGQRLTEDAPLETWRKEAGMDWTIAGSDLLYAPANANHLRKFIGKQVLSRSDTGAALSVVGSEYNIVQPGEVLEFFRDLIAEQGFKLETAGVLFRGRKFWALARVGKDIRIMGQDVVSPYLLLATSCDGSMATIADPTSVRVVCNNTLRMAVGEENKGRVSVHHGLQFDSEAVKRQLSLRSMEETIDSFAANITKLASVKVSTGDAIDIVASQLKEDWLTDEGDTMNQDQMVESSRVLRRIIALFNGDAKGSDYRSAKGTGWGLVNAVTEYFDHESGNKADRSRAFERANMTDRAKTKVAIADKVLALAA